jgi:hypothetical protein
MPDVAAYVRAYDAAREAGDVEAMGQAALGLASGRMFGTHPGRAPAFLFEAYSLATGALRTRLAVALTKSWVYGGSAERGVPFAAEAVELASWRRLRVIRPCWPKRSTRSCSCTGGRTTRPSGWPSRRVSRTPSRTSPTSRRACPPTCGG